MLTHVLPYGVCDVNGQNMHVGIFSGLACLLETQPHLMLCGHNNTNPSSQQKEQTVVVHPANLGIYKNNPGGKYAEIDYDPETGRTMVSNNIIEDRKSVSFKIAKYHFQ